MHTLYLYNGKLFAIRAGEHRLLRLKNFSLSDNSIIFNESMSKTFHGGLNDLKYTPCSVEHVCHKSGEKHEHCLLSLYKLYLSKVDKLAEGKESFHFKPHRDKSVFRYEDSVVGMNTLNSILPEKLCVRAGLERKTAHSLRVTCASRLYQNSIDDKRIRERTGHKSNALQRYERPCREQICQVSECLGVPKMLNLSTSIGDPEDGVSNVTLMQQRAKSDAMILISVSLMMMFRMRFWRMLMRVFCVRICQILCLVKTPIVL